MKKQKKKPRPTRKDIYLDGDALDWMPLFKAFKEAFEWSLDVAAALARDYPEELEAVERVRAFMRARIAGSPASVAVDDVLLTFGLVIGAIERDLGPMALNGPWFAPHFHFPGAASSAPTIPRVFADSWTRSPSTHRAFN